MGEAIGQTLPLAVGLALSPVPIIAVVVTLTTPRARSSGPAFVLGWLVGLGVVGTIVLVIAGSNTGGDQDQPAAWVRWLELVLGALLLALAVTQFRGRPRSGEQAPMPAWMNAIGRFTAGKVLGTGAVLAAADPKNLLLAVGGASDHFAAQVSRALAAVDDRVEATLTGREQAVLCLLSSPGSLDALAVHLAVSVNTVKTHVRAIYAKLGVNSRQAAVVAGRQLGLI